MKMRNYYLLMLLLCRAGALFGGFILLFAPEADLLLRLFLLIITLGYMLAAISYKKRLEEEERKDREKNRHRHEKNRTESYPENSYYKFIRRSV